MTVVKLQPYEPVPDTIDLLEVVLEKAKSGEIAGVAIVTMHPGLSIGTAFSDGCYRSVFSILGGIEYLKKRFIEIAVED